MRPMWERLGRLLIERRARIDPKYVTRKAFAEASGLNIGLLRDIETAGRDTYTPATRAALERAYLWTAGSIERVLAGGDPTELPLRAPTTPRPSPSSAAQPPQVRRLRPWFATGLERMGRDIDEVIAAVALLQDVAAEFGYSVPQLLSESGLLEDGAEPEGDPVGRFLAEYQQIRSSPHLSRAQRKKLDDTFREEMRKRGLDAET